MMFEEKMEYLSELRRLNEGDYHCHKEIAEVIESIRNELGMDNGIHELSTFILREFPDEIGKGVRVNGESAVDVAKRLMKK